MSCESTLPFPIIRGQSHVVTAFLTDDDGRPVDLTGLSEVIFSVHAATGVPIQTTFTGGDISVVGSPLLGEIQINLTSAKTTLYGLTNYDATNNPVYSSVQLSTTIAGNPDFNPNIKLIEGVLNITDPLS